MGDFLGCTLVGLMFAMPLAAQEGAAAEVVEAIAPSAEELFRPPLYDQVMISPDGEFLAALSAADGAINLLIARRDDLQTSELVTAFADVAIASFSWVSNDHLVFAIDPDGGGAQRIYSVDRGGQSVQLLVDPVGRRNQRPVAQRMRPIVLASGLPASDHALLALDLRERGAPDVYDLNAVTGNLSLVAENPGMFGRWVIDQAGQVRAAVIHDGDQIEIRHRHLDEPEWRVTDRFSYASRARWAPLAFDYDPAAWWIAAYQDGSTLGLFRVEPGQPIDGEARFVHPQFDVDDVAESNVRRQIVAVRHNGVRPTWVGLTEQQAAILTQLEAAFSQRTVEIVSASASEDWLIVHVYGALDPGAYYLFEPDGRRVEPLWKQRPWLENTVLAATEAVAFLGADGVLVNGYLTRPPGTREAAPMIVVLHRVGERDHWGFDPRAQYLATLGYATLRINYRSSPGLGYAFQFGADASLSGLVDSALGDIHAGVNWAVEQGIAVEDEVCLHGDIIALTALVTAPQPYACAVLWAPRGAASPDDIPATRALLDAVVRRVEATDEGDLLASLRAPVMIAYGRNDRHVSVDYLETLRTRLAASGSEPPVLILENEGHRVARAGSLLRYHRALAEFISARFEAVRAARAEAAEHVKDGDEAVSDPPENQ